MAQSTAPGPPSRVFWKLDPVQDDHGPIERSTPQVGRETGGLNTQGFGRTSAMSRELGHARGKQDIRMPQTIGLQMCGADVTVVTTRDTALTEPLPVRTYWAQ